MIPFNPSALRPLRPEEMLDARELKKIRREQMTLDDLALSAQSEQELIDALPF